MNKELIKKYKDEFEYWLLTNNCLLKTKVEGNWIEVTESTWNLSEDNLIVKNDEYVEFRKALAEGKTIEEYYCAWGHNGWTVFGGEFLNEADDYRIKPEEPQFKVGDWVRFSGIGNKLIKRFEDTDNPNEFKLWQPNPNEWFWAIHKYYTPILVQFVKKDKGVYIYTVDGNEGGTFDCEPFIGQLPSNLKDK